MTLSTKTKYGLRACFILALHPREVLPVTDLVRCTTISQKYLEKILGVLVKCGIIVTKRGANGGYMLSRAPSEISMGEIFRALEDNLEFSDCLSGTCNDEYCPNRCLLNKLYESMNVLLDAYSLEDLVRDNTCHNGEA